MISVTLVELAEMLGGDLVLAADAAGETIIGGRVDTDSRLVTSGGIFFAMRGAQRQAAVPSAHECVHQVCPRQAGASTRCALGGLGG